MTLPGPKLVCLMVLDGWGMAPESEGNAIARAITPNMDHLWASFPHTQLLASGEAVGLPKGEDGNTETGHLNLGAGRIVYQDLARINMSIADGTFFENNTFKKAFDHARVNNSKVHLMGLIGAGGVHSNIEHLFALLHFAKLENFSDVYLHLFTDGRDSPPTAAKSYLSQVEAAIRKEGVGKIASVMGRYWAMDRDLRWDRTAKAYFALTQGEGKYFKSASEVIDKSYSLNKTDEFIEPSLIVDTDNKPLGLISENDSVVFFNFRVDRPRQIARAFVIEDFEKNAARWAFDPHLIKYEKKHIVDTPPESKPVFKRGPFIKNIFFVTMTEYGKIIKEHGAHTAYEPETIFMSLGRVVSESGLRQVRISESEKERFVTFYFSGLQSKLSNEERIIIPSEKIATYDLSPEMKTEELTNTLLESIKTSSNSFALINYAAPDMVGHTGNIEAAIKACEKVDENVGVVANFILGFGGYLLITADHGNVEEMLNLENGEMDTEHSTNPVPFIAISREFQNMPDALDLGILADVSLTVLALLGITPPPNMSGRNLLERILRKAKIKRKAAY